jgi:hypothetical protein
MISALIRIINRVIGDPILQRWLLGRITGRWRPEPFHRLHPPYLNNQEAIIDEISKAKFADLSDGVPEKPLQLNLAGEVLTIGPDDVRTLMMREFADTESLLALHRFSWIYAAGIDCDPAWVNVMWRAWMEFHGEQNADSWAWHPYTVAERLINILGFAERIGLPGPREKSCDILAKHGPAIWQNLEYFGEINTGNHLANNGRGLFLGGLKLGLEDWVEQGRIILINEAQRIFSPAGILNEGSSHYHLLITRWYAECWLAAQAAELPVAAQLGEITECALAVLPVFNMPGDLPLIGDVSPDCLPEYLIGLMTGEKTGWLATLTDPDFNVLDQASKKMPFDRELAAAAGWLHKANGDWSTVWHVAPNGWSEQPGHAHQDFGSFELHYGNTPIFRDIGRRSYGYPGDQDVVTNAHNSLRINDCDPYPPNKPYYSENFRGSICGKSPVVIETPESLTIETNSFARYKNLGAWKRQWNFGKNRLTITDHVEGRGRHRIERYLHTTLPVAIQGNQINIGTFCLQANQPAATQPSAYWRAYGQSEPATTIIFSTEVTLPWSGEIHLETRRDI